MLHSFVSDLTLPNATTPLKAYGLFYSLCSDNSSLRVDVCMLCRVWDQVLLSVQGVPYQGRVPLITMIFCAV